MNNMNPFMIERGSPLWASSSFVPSVIKTKLLLNSDDHAHKDLLLQQYGERIEKLSQQAKEVENYQYTSALMVERLKLFFAQLFLLISSVSMEQSQICVRNTKPAK